MPSFLRQLPKPVARQLRAFYRRKRLYELLRVVLSVVTVYLLCALVVMHVDRFLFLEPSTRLLLTRGAHAVGVLVAVILFGGFLLRRISARRLAYELEDRLPLDAVERYVTLAELADAPETARLSEVGSSLLERLREETADYSSRFRAGRLVRDRRLKPAAGLALAVVAVYGVLLIPAGYQFPLMIQRFVDPRADLSKPSFVRIEVTPTEAVIGKGGEIVVQARTHGEMPAVVRWLYDFFDAGPDRCYLTLEEERSRTRTSSGGHLEDRILTNSATSEKPSNPAGEVHEMNRIQRNLFVFSRTDLQDSFQFRVRCADGETAVHSADVAAQPKITDAQMTITPPGYTNLPQRAVQDTQGTVQLYPGSHVSLEFSTDQPVAERRILLSSGETVEPEWDAPARTGRYAFEFEDDLELAVEVVNQRGFRNVDPVRLALRSLQDQKPVIVLNHPTGDMVSVPGELVPLEFEVEDDLGVCEVVVQYVLNPDQSADNPIKEIPVELPTQKRGAQKAAVSTMLDLDEIGAVPADTVRVVIRARDAAGNDGMSRAIAIRVEAFARGENERRRLEILDFLAGALRSAAADTAPDDPAAIAPAAYDTILESADRISLEIGSAPSLTSLLERLELEVHFTDEPQYKEDARMIAGIVRAAAMAAPEQPHRDILSKLGEQTLHDLTVYRRLKNLTWRVFGLGYELDSVREKIEDIQTHRQSALQARRELAADYLAGITRAVEKDPSYQDLLKRKADIGKEVVRIQRKIREESQGDEPPFSNPGGLPRIQPPPGRGQESAAVRQLRAELSTLAAEASTLDEALENRLAEIREQAAADDPDTAASLNEHIGAETLARAASRAVSEATTKQVPAEKAAAQVAAGLLDSIERGADPLVETLNRRTALYLATVESVGASLLALAETEKPLDEQACRDAQGELVSAVYRIVRKDDPLPRRVLACNQVFKHLRTLRELLIPLLPQYATFEQEARGKLREEFEGARNRVITRVGQVPGPPAPTPNGDVRSRTRESSGSEVFRLLLQEDWFRSDMRMMALNPYAPLWPYVRNLDLLEGRVRGVEDAAAENTEQDTAEAPAAARREAMQLQLLAFDRRLARVTSMDRIGAAEKALARDLIGLETSLALGPEIAVNPPSFYAERIRTFDSAGMGSRSRETPGESEGDRLLTNSAASQHLLELCPIHTDALSMDDPGVAALPRAQRWLVARDPVAALVETANAMQAEESAFDDLHTSLAAGEDPASDIAQLLNRTRRDLDRIEVLLMLLRLQLAYAPQHVPELEAREVLFLILRQSLGRYAVRGGRAVRSLDLMSRKTLSAADLTTATTDISALGRRHRALREGIQQSAARLREGKLVDQETRDRYPLLDTFRRTEAFAEAARRSPAADEPRAVAEQFLADFPEAASIFLVRRRGILEEVREPLERCRRELNADAPDASAYRSAVEQARKSLAGFRNILGLVTAAQPKEREGENGNPKRVRATHRLPPQLAATLESLDRQVRNLDIDPGTATATEVRVCLFALGDILQALQRALGTLDAAAGQTEFVTTAFTGGPDNTWADANRKSANRTRSRIAALARHANEAVVGGILGGLEGPDDTAASGTAVAWSRLLYRLVRSPLTGPVVIKTKGGGRDTAAEPLVAWLLEELDQAESEARRKGNLKHYSERTLEWIRSLKDFLRY